MTSGMFGGLTEELFAPDISPGMARTVKNELHEDSAVSTYRTAALYGNNTPRPAKKSFWDPKLSGTSTLAWYLDPREVTSAYPREGMQIEREIGSDPIIAFTPDLVYKKNKPFARSVAHHEGGHGGQPGKMILKSIVASTEYGMIPLGEMFLEGSNEWALEQRQMKAPSKFMEEMYGRKPAYGVYKDMVYEMEAHNHGIVRQVYRAATRGGPNAVIRLLESTPHMGDIINKYAAKLSRPVAKAA